MQQHAAFEGDETFADGPVIPELGKNLGKGLREFRNAMKGLQDDLENSTKLDKK